MSTAKKNASVGKKPSIAESEVGDQTPGEVRLRTVTTGGKEEGGKSQGREGAHAGSNRDERVRWEVLGVSTSA